MTSRISDTDRSKKQVTFLFSYALQVFGVVLMLGLFLRVFFFSSYVVSGWAMLPSVWPGDFLFASQWKVENVGRGAVVAMRCPRAQEQICLKRVIGIPGDRIEFREGQLLVNGQQAIRKPITPELEIELVAGKSWAVWPTRSRENSAPVVVPPRQFYLLNDKRTDGEDSRAWGPVDTSLLEAKVLAVWLSLDWFEGDEVRDWPRVRWSRILRRIH